MRKNVLVTGPPGCGKTTLLEKVVAKLEWPITGFLTREIRDKGRRVGFRIDTFKGDGGVFAHIDFSSRYHVGKYGVSIETLERIAIPALVISSPDAIVAIDEIGKMECLSQSFVKMLERVIASPNPVLATIAMRGDSFIEGLKIREDVTLLHITPVNRDLLVDSIASEVNARD